MHICKRDCPLHPGRTPKSAVILAGVVDRVHVDHVDVAKALQGEVLEQLAAEAARADHQYAALLLKEL